MTTGMIVLAGGIGKRIGRPFPKQFLLLGRQAADHPRPREGPRHPRDRARRHHLPGGPPRPDPRADREPPAGRRSSSASCGGDVAPGVGLQRAARARRRRLGPHPRGRPAAGDGRGVPRAHGRPGRERDVRHPDLVHRPQGPRLRRGPARARRAGQRPAAPEVRPRQAAARPRGGAGRRRTSSPRTPSLFHHYVGEPVRHPARLRRATSRSRSRRTP